MLLDAAVMEMQQYSSVVSQLDMTSKRPEAVTRASLPNSNPSGKGATQPPENNSQTQPSSETGARPKVKSRPAEASASQDDTATKSNEANPTNGEQDEVRKRRLERFGANAE